MTARRQAPALLGQPLTQREQTILEFIADGFTNREIGQRLYLASDTVDTHARRLFRKLGVGDRAHAVAEGFRKRLLDGAMPVGLSEREQLGVLRARVAAVRRAVSAEAVAASVWPKGFEECAGLVRAALDAPILVELSGGDR